MTSRSPFSSVATRMQSVKALRASGFRGTISTWMCMAFLVKLPSFSSFSPRPHRRAASPGDTDAMFEY
ncbi:hypothetical protein EYF80_052886 [Liparis tanakae]|uniref:Uncharacterized protein n=1 Tax=Liparis tanakae TaxID=230148 RepID=A0A4Z2F803_9TELE|nr:hypothetical protein EYF80_052886 [Liparis tanakae]